MLFRMIDQFIIDKLPDQLKLPFVLWDRKSVQSLIIKKVGVKKSLPQIGRYLNLEVIIILEKAIL
jgi:hypothetical protein